MSEPHNEHAGPGTEADDEAAPPRTPADAPGEDGTSPEEGASAPGDADPVAALREERDRLQNQLQRTLADLQNFRKRRGQEQADARRGGVETLILELLPVLDNFHLATNFGNKTGEEAVQSMQEGLLMIRSLLGGVFERHGVREIPALGERFDPSIHEAVGIDPRPEAEEGIVSQIMQKGYGIEDKVIRPTRVMVGGAPKTQGPADDDAAGERVD
jgi:molecular chaperone GrpE